jgi:dTDP-4-dehydrorhamnose reductase
MAKVLILGGSGMLGHMLYYLFSTYESLDVFATVRGEVKGSSHIANISCDHIVEGVDALNIKSVEKAIFLVRPDVVINCIAFTGKILNSESVQEMTRLNTCLPHLISSFCTKIDARLIHISTDGVFDGKRGMYQEGDAVWVSDHYGMTKFLGEVVAPHCLTIRTSIIGHEISGKKSLLEWFLNQEDHIKGFRKVTYSGLTTLELGKIIFQKIIPNNNLFGIYHLASEPISKYDLLQLIGARYGKKIRIEPTDVVVSDRSLDPSLFREKTGYSPPIWKKMLDEMHTNYLKNKNKIYV